MVRTSTVPMWMRGAGAAPLAGVAGGAGDGVMTGAMLTEAGRDDAGAASSDVLGSGAAASGADGIAVRNDAAWREAAGRLAATAEDARLRVAAWLFGATAAGCICGSTGTGGTAGARWVAPVSSAAAAMRDVGAADGAGMRASGTDVCAGALGAVLALIAAAVTSGVAGLAARRRSVGARIGSAASRLMVSVSTGTRVSAGGGRGTANNTGSPERSGSAMRCR